MTKDNKNQIKMIDIDFNKLIDENNNNVIKIFNAIKTHNWIELKNIINITNIDLNIKDKTNTYLLEYMIIFNQTDILDLLLEKNVRIDIIDDNSRSILYNVIKFSYFDILIKLININKISIGKSILEIKDPKNNIPLFYAIKFFNIKCVEIILANTTNYYIVNSDGDNGLHLAIKSQNFELFKLVISYFNDLKSRNKQGESYLHLIIKYKCYDMLEYFIKIYHKNVEFKNILNFVEYKYNFTILHYIAIELDFDSLKIISNYNLVSLFDGNIQDNSGNIPYHYFINNIIDTSKITLDIFNNINNINKIFQKINFNVNLYNIDGNTPAHIFFSNINFFFINKFNVLINWISKKSNMNIQNFDGNSIFYIIVKNNFWKQIKNILVTKKLDVFIIAENSHIIFDYIEKNDYGEFLTMITKSYLFQLSNEKTSNWIDYWDNRCKKVIKFNELNETELELIKNFGIKNMKSNDNICYQLIFNKLDKSIQFFIENKNVFYSTSYPVSNKFSKLISNYHTVTISTFSGSTIDVLCGLIYLNNKFNKIKNYDFTSTLELLKEKSNIIECIESKSTPLNNKNIYQNKLCEINGFEILWRNKNIFFPSNKNNSIINILKWMCSNKSLGYRWFCVPIGIEQEKYSHSNYLIFDIELMQVERFEPHGAFSPVGLNYQPDILDEILFDFLSNLELKFEYFTPKDYLPKIGFQIKEINELKNDYIGDPNGFCALWCIWWADIRLSNPNISRNKLVKQLTKELINGKYSYKKLIRDYSWYIIDLRDKFFIKANTNINEWINDTITEKNIDLLNNIISDDINKLVS